jgi:hypothetical protein
VSVKVAVMPEYVDAGRLADVVQLVVVPPGSEPYTNEQSWVWLLVKKATVPIAPTGRPDSARVAVDPNETAAAVGEPFTVTENGALVDVTVSETVFVDVDPL